MIPGNTYLKMEIGLLNIGNGVIFGGLGEGVILKVATVKGESAMIKT